MNKISVKSHRPVTQAAAAALAFGALVAMAPLAGAAGAPPTLRPDGVGPVRVGMDTFQIRAALGEKTVKLPDNAPDAQCFYLRAQQYPELRFLMEGGTLRRIDTREAGMSTADGIRRGDTLAKVQALYGERLKTESSKTGGGKDWTLTVQDPDGVHATRFETRDGYVEHIVAGFTEQVENPGCV